MLASTELTCELRCARFPQFTWCEEASDTALLQHGLLWGYLERLSVEETVPGFVEGEPFETPAPAQDNDA